ncbi:MAG: hypothetical protein KC620_09185 [Myxococcales bacterium]|nr:hypothetical protein [Myxococcales bacterium]
MFPRLHVHEILLAGLLAALTGALALRAGPTAPIFYESAINLGIGLLAVLGLRGTGQAGQKLRLLIGAGLALWLLLRLDAIAEGLAWPPPDAFLLKLERGIFGETPSVRLADKPPPLVFDIAAVSAVVWPIYIGGLWLVTLMGRYEPARRLTVHLTTALTLAMAAALLVSARGPQAMFPELYLHPLPGGLAAGQQALADAIAPKHLAFPTVMVPLAGVALMHAKAAAPKRLWLLVPLFIGLLAATLLLRGHYAISVVVGLLAWAGAHFGLAGRPDVDLDGAFDEGAKARPRWR